MKMDHAMHLISYGVFLGYSTDSIVEFIKDFNYINQCEENAYGEWNTNRLNTRTLANSWHIIASTEIGKSEQELIDAINKNRYCKTPFPCTDDEHIFVTIDDEIDVLMETNTEFSSKVVEITIYLMNINEVHDDEETD